MQALVYNESAQGEAGGAKLLKDHPLPVPSKGEALVRVIRAGVCATDLEITRGYVPGYNGVLGHEFVGIVEACDAAPALVGARVVGEINCNDARHADADAIAQRNHAPGRSVLGIIGRDGCFAQFCALPASNLLRVPQALTDAQAAFAEPLAAACRLLEQQLLDPEPQSRQTVAVLGDGRLGLLIAAVAALHAPGRVTHFGRHEAKLGLVKGTAARIIVGADTAARYAGTFDLVVEASGSASGVRTALALTRPMGTLVLKTTVAPGAIDAPDWAELANDVVVNEKKLVGSRCGPMDVALQLMAESAPLRELLDAMVAHELPLEDGVAALELARSKGTLKVQLIMPR